MDIARLRNLVLGQQQVLARIYNSHGGLNLADYARQWPVAPAGQSLDRRRFLSVLAAGAGALYKPELAGQMAAQLLRQPLVSTIDHHGIFGHPFFLNANLVYALRDDLDYLVCLPTAGISLNNSSWPGCLLVTGDDARLHRLSFFPDKSKTRAVLSLPRLTSKDISRLAAKISAAAFLPLPKGQELIELVRQIFDAEVLAHGDFSSQAAVASGKLWQTVFPRAPRLIYVPLETQINRVIVELIAPEPAHALHRLLFTVSGWDMIERYFQGSPGAFSGGHKGSFLFWSLGPSGHRLRLKRRGAYLENEQLTVMADPSAVVSRLNQGELYPTSLVCFLVLLYYEMTCLGGFNQVNWLSEIRQKFVSLLKQSGQDDLAVRVAGGLTENFAETNLAFAVNGRGEIYQPPLLDLFLAGDGGVYQKYRELARQLTLGESINTQLPEIYRVITPAAARDQELLKISQTDVLRGLGIESKIRSRLCNSRRGN